MAEHQALRKFVTVRSNAPDVGEAMLNVTEHGKFKTLHSGRTRGVTFYDASEDVCWLMGWGETHATGEDRDVFKVLESLHEDGLLMPSDDDYLALFPTREAEALELLEEACKDLYAQARSNPNQVLESHFELGEDNRGSLMVIVDIVVFDSSGDGEEGCLSFGFAQYTSLDESDVVDMLDRVLPDDVDIDTVERVFEFNGQPLEHNYVAWKWCCLPE